jgi:hypothetical protein
VLRRTPDGIRGAAAAGVEALITNDRVMAKRALGPPPGHKVRIVRRRT